LEEKKEASRLELEKKTGPSSIHRAYFPTMCPRSGRKERKRDSDFAKGEKRSGTGAAKKRR